MTSREILDRVKSSLLDLDMHATVGVADSIVRGDGAATVEEAVDAIAEGLEVVGTRFQEGEWYLAELVYAGEIAKQVMDLLSPHMAAESSAARGTVVVGTVAGDLHDLGKNIFVSYAKSAGFDLFHVGHAEKGPRRVVLSPLGITFEGSSLQIRS